MKSFLLFSVLSVFLPSAQSFVLVTKCQGSRVRLQQQTQPSDNDRTLVLDNDTEACLPRRRALQLGIATLFPLVSASQGALAAEDPTAFAQQRYEDFTVSDEGYSYRDVKLGKTGAVAQVGDRVVLEWSGYTVGYFGRPFEAKGGPQGGAFDKEQLYIRTVLGSNTMVTGLEKGMVGMQSGGIRQILVPYGPNSYPTDDAAHDRVGPKPNTFSGQRALNFVLENPRVDRTLLFNVKVIRVDKPDGKGGFLRG